MNNSKKETISTGKKAIFIIPTIIATRIVYLSRRARMVTLR